MTKLDIEKVKKWYRQKLWSKSMLIEAASKGKLTPEQYEEITGEVLADE